MSRFLSFRQPQGKNLLGQELLEVVEANPKGLPMINITKDMRVSAMDSVELIHHCQHLEEKLLSSHCLSCPLFEKHVCALCPVTFHFSFVNILTKWNVIPPNISRCRHGLSGISSSPEPLLNFACVGFGVGARPGSKFSHVFSVPWGHCFIL